MRLTVERIVDDPAAAGPRQDVRGYDVTLVRDAHTTADQTAWGAPPPELVIAHTNLLDLPDGTGADGPDGQDHGCRLRRHVLTPVQAFAAQVRPRNGRGRRDNSSDSRVFGPVPVATVKGRIVYRCLPMDRAGPIG